MKSNPGTVQDARVFRLRMPLSTPYNVAFMRFDAFEVFLARVVVDGREGIGETVTSPGYSRRHEASESIWEFLREKSAQLVGTDAQQALQTLGRTRVEHPFAAVGLVTAIESALHSPEITEDKQVSLLGTVMTHKYEELDESVEELLLGGYRTLKVKVGWDEREDAARVRRIQEIVEDRALIRVDANQGYDFEQASYFVNELDPANIEVFEQPFGVGNWKDMVRLSERSPLPLMLDESIVSDEDLEKAIQCACAQAVKFKLMRAGSFERLRRLILQARGAGLKVILGNGVASDIGDYHELVAASELIETAGEMNGFLKQEQSLLSNPYPLRRGAVELVAGYAPKLDWEKVDYYTVDASPENIIRDFEASIQQH